MKRDELLELLASHQAELVRLGVRSLALFGSVARDEGGPDSDVDLLVEFEEGQTFDRYASLASFLEDLLGLRVDLVTRAAVRPFLLSAIEKDTCYVPGLPSFSGRHPSGV